MPSTGFHSHHITGKSIHLHNILLCYTKDSFRVPCLHHYFFYTWPCPPSPLCYLELPLVFLPETKTLSLYQLNSFSVLDSECQCYLLYYISHSNTCKAPGRCLEHSNPKLQFLFLFISLPILTPTRNNTTTHSAMVSLM